MVALGGDLYVYGGAREMPDGEDTVLSDILVARAQNGVVNQPWKHFTVSKSPPFTHSDLQAQRTPSQSRRMRCMAPHQLSMSNCELTCS